MKVFRHAYYGPDGDWDDKDEIVVTEDMVKSWKPKVANSTGLDSHDSRTFIETSTDELEEWASLGTSLLESFGEDEEDSDENEDMGAYVEYRALTADDNHLIRLWIHQHSTTTNT